MEWKDWDNIDLNEDKKESNVDIDRVAESREGTTAAKDSKVLKGEKGEKDLAPAFGLAVLAMFDYSSGWSDTWVEPKKGGATEKEEEEEPSTSEAVCESLVRDLVNEVLQSKFKDGARKRHRHTSCIDFPSQTSMTLANSCFFFCKRIRSVLQSFSISRSYKKELNKKSKRKQIQEWKKRKMEKKQKEYTEIWLNKILPNWYNLRDDPWVKLSWKQGLPPAVRGLVWPLALGNSLRITEELYNYYTTQVSLEIDQDKIISSFEASTKQILDELSVDVYIRRLRTATKMAMGKQEAMLQIEQDIHRTFSSLKLFKPGSELYGHLRTVLGAFVIYRPDVGYVQGMSYLAGMFLLYMDPPEAFMCLCNLLTRHFFLAFLSADTDHVYNMFGLFSKWLEISMPSLANHFEAIHLAPELYLLNWAFTMYAKILPLDTACLIWDTYMLEGELVIFKTALALLKIQRKQLLACSFDQAIKILLQRPEDWDLDPEMFLKSINNIVVPDNISESLLSMQRKYYAPQLEIDSSTRKNGRSPARLRIPSSPASFQRYNREEVQSR